MEKVFRQVRLNTRSDIAGRVAPDGKALTINGVNQDERFNEGGEGIPGLVNSTIICAPPLVHRQTRGVSEVLHKLNGSYFSGQDLTALASVSAPAAMTIENVRLQPRVLNASAGTIKALAATIEAKDPYTRGHSQRVTQYALLGATSLSFSPPELEALKYAGILHDIGKIGIPDSILSKPGRLTAEEWEIMFRHPLIGARILKEIPFLEKIARLVLHHHERYDGNGYPHGLKREDIPLGARLLAVADAFDTMTTDRSYRAAPGVDQAIQELYRCSGTQFCPVAVAASISGLKKLWQTFNPRSPVSRTPQQSAPLR